MPKVRLSKKLSQLMRNHYFDRIKMHKDRVSLSLVLKYLIILLLCLLKNHKGQTIYSKSLDIDDDITNAKIVIAEVNDGVFSARSGSIET